MQELYALSLNRSAIFANSFLRKFLPQRTEGADDYSVPQYSQVPSHRFRSVEELLKFLEKNPVEEYGIYWNSCEDGGEVLQAMLFYTSDNHLILGLAVGDVKRQTLLNELLKFSGTGIGYITNEERPPNTAFEFRELATKYMQLK